MSRSVITAPEWDSLGATIRHIARLHNPSSGAQAVFVSGFRTAADVYDNAGVNGWASFIRAMDETIERAETDEPTPHQEAYIASLRSVAALARTSAPAEVQIERSITLDKLHALERNIAAETLGEERAMKIAIAVVASKIALHGDHDAPLEVPVEVAKRTLAEHRENVTRLDPTLLTMTTEELQAYDEMAKKITG